MHLAFVFRFITYSVAMAMFILGAGSYAATQLDLYTDTVIVSQDAPRKEQTQAIRQAFKRLLIRVSGIEQVLSDPIINAEVDNSASYLAALKFGASDALFTNVLGESVPTKQMIMRFDKVAIDNLLIKNRQPVWGGKRPDTLVLLADRVNGGAHILADGEDSLLANELKNIARARGIPYVLPIMDLEDSLAFDFSSIFGLFSSDIEQAAQRYRPDAILNGRITELGNDQLQADWLILIKGDRYRLPTVQGTQQQVVAQGIDFLARHFSSQYALILDPSQQGMITLEVSQVESLQSFALLEAYLNGINLITQVTLSQYADDKIAFALHISGNSTQLADIIALDNKLLPMIETEINSDSGSVLRYQWQGDRAE